MSRIQIADLNSSDFGFLSELTDEEILDINGGGFWKIFTGFALVVAGALTTPVGIGAALIGAGAAILASEEF